MGKGMRRTKLIFTRLSRKGYVILNVAICYKTFRPFSVTYLHSKVSMQSSYFRYVRLNSYAFPILICHVNLVLHKRFLRLQKPQCLRAHLFPDKRPSHNHFNQMLFTSHVPIESIAANANM